METSSWTRTLQAMKTWALCCRWSPELPITSESLLPSLLTGFVSSASLITAPWRPNCSSGRVASAHRAATDSSSTPWSKGGFFVCVSLQSKPPFFDPFFSVLRIKLHVCEFIIAQKFKRFLFLSPTSIVGVVWSCCHGSWCSTPPN